MTLGKKESKDNKVIHIKHWPEGDRPRERLLEKGPEVLSNASKEKKCDSCGIDVPTYDGGFFRMVSYHKVVL